MSESMLDSLPGKDSVSIHPLAEPFASATTWLMWRKGMLGANLNAWIDLQQEGKVLPETETRAIA
jgi:hypothetical protein